MIILRVAMGHGLVRETVDQIDSALVFADAPPAKKQHSEKSSDGTQTTLGNSESGPPTYGEGMFPQGSDMSLKKQRSTFEIVSPV